LASSSTQRRSKTVRKLRSLKGQDPGFFIFYDKDEFRRFLEEVDLDMEREDFSTFLNGTSSTDLEVGENNVGSFDITIEQTDSNANVGSIEDDGDGDGVYAGIYENEDATEIKLENFYDKGNKIYAFGSKWDIDQEVCDLTDYCDVRGRRGPPSDSYDEEEYEGHEHGEHDHENEWKDYYQESEHEGHDHENEREDGWKKMLHLKVGRVEVNLVDELDYGNTNFLGFFSQKGFVDMEIFSPENEDPIDFEMYEVYVSSGTPTDLPPGYGGYGYFSWFELIRIFLGFLLTFDFDGFFAFLDNVTSNGGDKLHI